MIRPGVTRLFRLAIRRWRAIEGDAARDVDEEIRTHLELRADTLVRDGWTHEAARREAERRFGSLADTRRELRATAATRERDMHISEWLSEIWFDLVHGVRALRREPAFTAFVVATLALGLGANAAMFGIVDRLLVSAPAHVRDADRVRRLQIALQPAGMETQRSGWFGYVTYDVLRHEARSLAEVAAYSVQPEGTILGRGTSARRINLGEATASLFRLLGVRPAIGRFYDEKDDDTAAPEHVVVLGYGLWQQDYGGRPDIVGQRITLDTREYTIVGVAPRGFTGPDLTRVDAWLPESLLGPSRRSTNWTGTWNSAWLSIVVRLKDGVTDAQADAEATTVVRRAYVGSDSAKARATLAVRPLRFARDGEESAESRVSKWLFAVAIIVLAIACANVVNLLLARALRRRREMAVRLTLGAGRWRVIRLAIVETLALAFAGGAAGLAVAYGIGSVTRTKLLPDVEWTSPPVDLKLVGVSALVAILVGLVVGLVPSVQASTPDLTASLNAGAREGGGRMGRIRATLTVAQAALSVVLLVGAGLFMRSLQQVRALDLGLQPNRVLTFSVQRTGLALITDSVERLRERERRLSFYPMVAEVLGRRPDVEAVSLTIGLAFTSGFGEDIRVPGRDSVPRLKGGGPYLNAVSADYFKTVGTRVLRGRSFSTGDRAGTEPVAIVNETMTATLWPGEDPLGKCFMIGQSPACTTIVGIAVNARRFRLREDEAMAFYIPFGQEQSIGGTQLLVRPRGEAAGLVNEVRRELSELDPSIIFVNAGVLQDRLDPQIRPWRLGASMFSLMGALAFLVAALGLYSVMSYLVTHRTHEMGVRIALGATSSDVMRLIVRGGLALAITGVAIGLALALAAARFIEPLLFDTSPRDPVVFGGVALALLSAAVIACIVPGARAARVNPMEAMRVE